MNAGCRHWWRSSQGRFAAIFLLSLATAAEASGGPCDSEVWSNSKCCRERNGLTIGGVTEDVLSAIDCDSSVEGTHLVQLEWHHSTLYEENHKLDRVFLFSHCINPTNTSLAPSMSTLLFSSDRTHLTSSTTLSYPIASSCTYFGCYGANRGYNFYTFQEVSCTATIISSTADMILSTPIIYLVESTTLPVSPTLVGGQKPTPSPTTTQLAVTSTSQLALRSSQDLPRSTVITSPSTAGRGKQTPSSTVLPPTPSGPTSSQRSETAPFWAWVLGISLLLLVAAFAAAGSYLYVTQVIIGRPRDIRKDMKDLSWHADTWNGASEQGNLLKNLDKLSLHSVHTQYDCIFLDQQQAESLDGRVSNHSPEPPPLLPPPPGQEDVNTESSAKIANSSSQTTSSSGVSTCDTDFTTTSYSGDGSGVSTQSYITYGSLCTLQTRSPTDQSNEDSHVFPS